jgi:hypothetical protein
MVKNRAGGNRIEPREQSMEKYSIALRFRNNNLLIIISVLIVVAIVVTIIVDNIVDDMSKKYAQLCSFETVEKFDLYLKKELQLVQIIAQSKELIQWFADEDNPEKKFEAYGKIMSYVEVMYGKDFYFGIEGSPNAYTVNKETPFEDFKPFEDPLDANDRDDQWYFDCIMQNKDYVLNIDVEKYSHKKRLWIN